MAAMEKKEDAARLGQEKRGANGARELLDLQESVKPPRRHRLVQWMNPRKPCTGTRPTAPQYLGMWMRHVVPL